MKKQTRKTLALLLAMVMLVGILAACGNNPGEQIESTPEISNQPNVDGPEKDPETKGGKLLFMSNITGGPAYDFYTSYMDMWTSELGYTYEVIYGDPANDPAGNLTSVKNAMTNDVVGVIMMQDGGVIDVLKEYPELNVVGFANDMMSVFGEDAPGAAAASDPRFLGTVAGGYADGNNTGKMLAETVIEKGYKSVAIVTAPAFAYPQYAVADKAFRAVIDAHNETADEEIVVVGDEPTVTMFRPLDDTYFSEPQHQNLDVVIGFCGGQGFIYPVLATAIDNNLASADTKLLTFGLESDQALIDDVGTGIIQGLFVPNFEELFFALVMLDNAIQGKQFADFTKSEILDGAYVHITSDEIMTVVENDSPLLSHDMSKLALSMEDGKQYFTRYNSDATYAALVELMYSDTFTELGYQK